MVTCWFTCQGPNVDYLLTSRRLCSNRDYGMDGTASHTRQTQKHHLQTKRARQLHCIWSALFYFGREMNQTQQQCIIIDLAILVAWRKNSWAEQVSFVWCMSIWASRMGECWLVLWHSQDSAELTSNDGTELGRSTYRTVLRVLANSEHTQKWDGLQTLPQSAILAVWAIL